MRVYLCGDTAHDLDPRRNQVKLNVTKDRKKEGLHESRKGRGREIMYDQLVKHGCIICREIKVSQKTIATTFMSLAKVKPSFVLPIRKETIFLTILLCFET